MNPLPLRDYQSDALAALDAGWAAGKLRLAVVLPTGMGKTVVFAHLAAASSDRRVLVLVHREELAEQAAEKIRAVAPGLSVGIVKAERDEYETDVVVASVQTLARPPRRERITDVGLVIVDEAHHAVARTWMEVLEHFGAWRSTPVAGFTATMSREDGRGLGNVWQEIVLQRDILDGIDAGYLVDVAGKAVTVDGLDLGTVARSRGDYQDGALGDALEASGAGDAIARSYAEHAPGRAGVLFAPTVATARSFADDLDAAGITSAVITGTTSTEDRKLIYKRYRAGDIQVLSNCMVLTEGWDAPWCSVAVIARPTTSAALYVQMVGRVLRPFPGKASALVLDVVGVTGQHALRTIADLTATAVTPRTGESLAAAVQREADEKHARKATRSRVTGTLAAADVDLFHRSASVWLRTYKGAWFIPTKDWTFFLWPAADGELFMVGRKATYSNRGADRGGWISLPMDLGYAMAHGEREATDADPSIALKNASWRRGKPSDAQLGLLARYRITIPENVRKGDVSDLISIHLASRDLDPRS